MRSFRLSSRVPYCLPSLRRLVSSYRSPRLLLKPMEPMTKRARTRPPLPRAVISILNFPYVDAPLVSRKVPSRVRLGATPLLPRQSRIKRPHASFLAPLYSLPAVRTLLPIALGL